MIALRATSVVAAIASWFLSSTLASGQQDTSSIELDLLRAPNSPGSVLLEFGESDVERPSNPTAFMFSLRQASNDLSALPKNWAIDLAPGMLLSPHVSARQMIGLAEGDAALKPGQRIWQSAILSLATRNLNTASDPEDAPSNDPQLAVGFKVSLCEGRPSAATRAQFARLDTAMKAYVTALNATEAANLTADSTYVMFDKRVEEATTQREALRSRIDTLKAQLLLASDEVARESLRLALAIAEADRGRWTLERDVASKLRQMRVGELDAQLKDKMRQDQELLAAERDAMLSATESFKVLRVGFKCDISSGLVLDFVDREANNSRLSKAGIWTTAGWETEENVAFFLFARWLANPGKRYLSDADTIRIADLADVDLGARILLEPNGGRFSFSTEAVYRQPQRDLGLDPTWRIVANTAYDLGENRRLAFSFGKNYDGTTQRSDNLIIALNFLMGFGDKKEIH